MSKSSFIRSDRWAATSAPSQCRLLKDNLKKSRSSVYGIHCGSGVDTVKDIIPEDWTFSSQTKLQRGPKGFTAHLLKWDSLCHTVAAVAAGEPSWLQVYLKTITGDHSPKEMLATSLKKQYSLRKDGMEYLVAGTDKKIHRPEWHSCQPLLDAMQSTCAGRRFRRNKGILELSFD